MGKSEVYVNGKLLKKQYGGYLPVILDVTEELEWGKENVIAVKADNSDDPLYPVGKAQNMLDFTYFGGIYRDCWLVAHNDVFITNANYENEVAGGGLFVSFADVSEKSAVVNLKAHIRNNSMKGERVTVSFELKDKQGKVVKQTKKKISVKKGTASYALSSMLIESPCLWSPEDPYLYDLDIMVHNEQGKVIDGYRQRVGIRSIEFKQNEGLWINGKPYDGKLMGTNRHQDFAVLGNALPNSMQWRDAKKLRDAGLKVIRTHYVIDPAFMDACDELGVFALVEVPGWQFWNNESVFGERVYSDIRNMIRIHRNHASLFFWEPILNETHYPDEFAKKALDICEEEYPYPYSIAACDHGAAGDHYYSLLLRPIESDLRDDKTYFIREWGDNVDDWNAQNSDSRVARGWGEVPMLIQAEHYANPSYIKKYPILCCETICNKPKQIVGACFWHSFDHQRGYHADPFYGGIMDAFRQPKTSYYAFMSQRPQKSQNELGSGPVVYIANECTPFSPEDVTVFSNCDSVRLSVNGGAPVEKKVGSYSSGLKRVPVVFPKAWDFMENKKLARAGKEGAVKLVAEGLIGGKVVTRHEVRPSRRAEKIRLRLDREEGVELSANGSDVFAVVAEVTDSRGTVKRLNDEEIVFSIEGPAELLTDSPDGTLVQPVKWGSAPALVRLGTQPGTVTVKASVKHPGSQKPVSGVLKFDTKASGLKMLFQEDAVGKSRKGGKAQPSSAGTASEREEALQLELEKVRHELNNLRNDKVSRQQSHFE